MTVGEHAIRARRIVIATGSAPALPPIPGLAEVPFLTNETVFDGTRLPEHLIVIGCGPIGMEMAQAHRLLGARVSVLEAATALPKDDPELVACWSSACAPTASSSRSASRIRRVELSGGGVAAVLEDGGAERRVEGSHLLVAAGRRANLAGLDLDKAGIATDERGGLVVDRRLRTEQPPRLCRRRRRGRAAIHPCRGVSRRHRHPQRVCSGCPPR